MVTRIFGSEPKDSGKTWTEGGEDFSKADQGLMDEHATKFIA